MSVRENRGFQSGQMLTGPRLPHLDSASSEGTSSDGAASDCAASDDWSSVGTPNSSSSYPTAVYRELWQEEKAANARQEKFLALVVHELRNPLAPISAALELLQMQPLENPVQAEALTILRHQVDRLTDLVNDLFQASRLASGQIEVRKELVDLGAVVRSAVNDARPLISKQGRELLVTLAEQPLQVHGDGRRLEQVVMNLLHNALKYTSPGGCIWIELTSAPGEAVLRIRDSGRGISPELLPTIFDCFIQGDGHATDTQVGMGVGLALVKQFVELHGGSVRASSDGPGCGADFVVILPLTAGGTREVS